MKIRGLMLAMAACTCFPFSSKAQIDTSSTVVIVAGQEAALAYNKGLADIAQGDAVAAIRDFGDAIHSNGRFHKAYYNRGVVELQEFRSQAALGDFDDAIAVDQSKPYYHLGRAIALARMERYTEALDAIKKAENRGCAKTTSKYFYGYVYFRQGNYQQAVKMFSDAIGGNPKFAYAYCDRASAHLKAKNVKAALDDYNTALEIMPTAHFVYLLRADAKAEQGNYNAALADINAAMMLVGDDTFECLNARGVMYGRAGKYQKAMQDFKAACDKKPSSPDPYINMGNMLTRQKKYAEAEAQFTKAIELDAGNIAAYNNRANVRELQFRLGDARQDRDKADQLAAQSRQYSRR